MEARELVKYFLAAWNSLETDIFLAHMTDDAIYYDAFWNEYCKKDDLRAYIQEYFSDDPFVYELSGEIYQEENKIAYHYKAKEKLKSGKLNTRYTGAEILSLKNGKIAYIEDHYCPVDPAMLKFRATYLDHTANKYARSGLRREKAAELRARLLQLMADDRIYLDQSLTLPNVADKLGVSNNHLSQVVNYEFASNFRGFLNRYRVDYAKGLLLGEPSTRHQILDVAEIAGFASVSAFYSAFKKNSGMTPKQFQKHHLKNK